jgi:hypothetical protein
VKRGINFSHFCVNKNKINELEDFTKLAYT